VPLRVSQNSYTGSRFNSREDEPVNKRQFSRLKGMLLAGFVAVFFSNFAAASEIDSFTRRFEYLENSAPVINAKVNECIAGAVERANGTGKGCDEDVLYTEIKKELGIILMNGPLIMSIVSSPDVPKHDLTREESIYKYFRMEDGFLLVFPLVNTLGVGMGVTFNFNGTYIGSDKFEHLFHRGSVYFDSVYRRKEDLASVLYDGMVDERLLRGGRYTGVYSYADLFAGFTGMRFWNHILQQYPDVLGEDMGPYVRCQDNRWLRVKEIDFGSYIDAGFDEGYNCSSLITTNGLYSVNQVLSELNVQHGTNRYKCPLDAEVIDRLWAKYEKPVASDNSFTIADFIFNPAKAINKYTSFWPPGHVLKWYWIKWIDNYVPHEN